MNITINKNAFFDYGVYRINNDMEIMLFSRYIKTFFDGDGINNIYNICDETLYMINELKKHNFNDNNCLVYVFNISGDEYLYIWDIENDDIYDMDCNDTFNISYDRGIRCILSGLSFPILIGYNL